jgi:hypothetical protein
VTRRTPTDVDRSKVPPEPALDDRKLERLLSGRDSPSVSEKEELFERIYARSEPGRRRWLVPSLGAALASAAAVVLMVTQLRGPSVPEFQARGGGALGAGPELALSCSAEPCREGAKLSFAVRSASGGYFAAFARRSDGVVIWYFPEASAESQPVPGGGARAVLDRAVVLGPEHLPGRYEVFGVFTARPLTRDELKLAIGDDLAGTADTVVVKRSMEVLP